MTSTTNTVEELETELQEVLLNIDAVAQEVLEEGLDSYEGFMQTEKYKNRIVEIGNLLKERGIDITTRTE
ncbi:MAG: hypothetical protein DRN14_07220 [Thermoplasmata archaeon]|nr:MAG: hypothetical protein DRN14_07220 [Thermoplasmata archaeon]